MSNHIKHGDGYGRGYGRGYGYGDGYGDGFGTMKSAGATRINTANKASKDGGSMKVLVTTSKRGVFFGEMDGEWDGESTVELTGARMCVYWSADVRGVHGLAVTGPTAGCRIGPKVKRLKVNFVDSVAECAEAAVEAFEVAPWSR